MRFDVMFEESHDMPGHPYAQVFLRMVAGGGVSENKHISACPTASPVAETSTALVAGC